MYTYEAVVINIARYLQVKTNLSRISYIYIHTHTIHTYTIHIQYTPMYVIYIRNKVKRLRIEGIVNFKYNRNISLFLSEFYKNNFKTWYMCIYTLVSLMFLINLQINDLFYQVISVKKLYFYLLIKTFLIMHFRSHLRNFRTFSQINLLTRLRQLYTSKLCSYSKL